MTAQEWKHFADLLQKARTGNEKAIREICEFIDSHMKAEIQGWLWKAGVGDSVDEAYQDVLLAVLRKIPQLEVVDCWEIWLWRVAKSIAKNYRPHYVKYPRPKPAAQHSTRRPKQIGASINGHVYPVTVPEPYRPPEQKTRRQRVVEPLSDSAITNWSMSNRPDYPRRIDVWDAMGRLPARWAVALRLTQVEGYTAPETAGILGCSVPRVYRLVQKGKRRMRELLAGYGQNGGGKVKMKIEVAPGYSVEYIESFYSSDEADALLRALLAVEMTPEVIRMYGRDTVTKRRSEQYGAEYRYNAKAKDSQEWTSLMLSIRERMESIAGPLDGGLVQVYPDGETGIGWHQDKGKPEIIVSLSLGAEREFSFGVGPASKCQEVWRMRLAHGSLLLIPAKTNEALKHRLPPAKRIKEPRVNVTLRRFPQCG